MSTQNTDALPMIQATQTLAERGRGFAVGHYVRFWPDGESGARWMEGEVARVHEGIVLEISPRRFSGGWGVVPLADDARIDPSYDLLRQGALQHVERIATWTLVDRRYRFARRPGGLRATLQLQNSIGVRAVVEFRREGARGAARVFFHADDERRAQAACLRVAADILDESADRVSRGAPPLDVEDPVVCTWPDGGRLDVSGPETMGALRSSFRVPPTDDEDRLGDGDRSDGRPEETP